MIRIGMYRTPGGGVNGWVWGILGAREEWGSKGGTGGQIEALMKLRCGGGGGVGVGSGRGGGGRR